jgi:type II secretory pathway component PulF
MPKFTYQAVKPTGERISGEFEASSKAEAYKRLDREKLQPISLSQVGAPATAAATADKKEAPTPEQPSGPIRLSRKQIIVFTEEMGDLLEAGLQLEPALRIMEEREESSSIKRVTHALRQQVRDGISFSTALRNSSPSFGDLYCNLVSAGELSGALPQILRRQSQYLIAMDELQARVVQALIYPAFIFTAGIALLFVFMTVLVPQLTVLFKKTDRGLPLVTTMLIGVSNFFVQYWWAMLIILFAGIFGFFKYISRDEGKLWWHRVQLKLPLFGNVLTSRYYTQFSQTMANLLGNGVPLLSALKLMNAATGNVHLRNLMTRVVDIVGEGGSLTRAMKRVGEFPPLFLDMVAVGEQTGDLATSLEKAGNRYDKELTKKIQRLTALIQPVVIFVMAGLVGVVAYSIITGIFQAISGLRTGG